MLDHIFENDAVFEQIKTGLENNQGPVLVSGCTDGAKAHLVSALRGKKKRGSYKVIVTADENKAKEWVENYRFFGEDAGVIISRFVFLVYETSEGIAHRVS